MMDYGFEDNRFYVEYSGCTCPPTNIRHESDLEAQRLYAINNKLILCLSSGLDSQTALHSFKSQGIPIDCYFMHLKGFNDSEFENLKTIERKYSFKTNIIEIDPEKNRDECLHLANAHDTNPHHALHYLFVNQMPKEHDIIQVHTPWFVTKKSSGKHYLYHSFYDPEISRIQLLSKIQRTGNIKSFGSTGEYFASVISDEVIDYFLKSWQFYNDPTITRRGEPLHDVFRYEFYVKPLLYAKHWGDELFYFPKFAGFENIPWLANLNNETKREHMVFVEKDVLLNFLLTSTDTKKFYESTWNNLN